VQRSPATIWPTIFGLNSRPLTRENSKHSPQRKRVSRHTSVC